MAKKKEQVYKLQISGNRIYYFVSMEAAQTYQQQMATAKIEILSRKEYEKEVGNGFFNRDAIYRQAPILPAGEEE
jgi:hypothetical protein